MYVYMYIYMYVYMYVYTYLLRLEPCLEDEVRGEGCASSVMWSFISDGRSGRWACSSVSSVCVCMCVCGCVYVSVGVCE